MTCLELSPCPQRFGMEFFQRCWENLLCPHNRNLRQPSLVLLFWELGLWTPAVVHGASWFLRLPLATEQKGFIWSTMESWEVVSIWAPLLCLSEDSLNVFPFSETRWKIKMTHGFHWSCAFAHGSKVFHFVSSQFPHISLYFWHSYPSSSSAWNHCAI